MAGKGTECGKNIEEIKYLLDNVIFKNKIGVCLDTCHLNDSGVNLKEFDSYLDEFDKSDDAMEKLKREIDEDEEKLKSEKNFDQRKLLISGLTFLRQQYKQRHVKNEFDASIIRLGDLEICQIPAELFSCFGLQIKAASKARYCIIWGYTNGMVGYMVKAEEYETCYEGRSTTFRQGEPERVTENLVELMKKHCE